MKRMFVFFMFVLCLFGTVAVANAAVELTEDQMARQFGGTMLDPFECQENFYAHTPIGDGWYTCYPSPHGCYPESYFYNIICTCFRSGRTVYFICPSDSDMDIYDFYLQYCSDDLYVVAPEEWPN